MNAEKAFGIRMIVGAVMDSIKSAGPSGTPAGHIYAALMAHGCTLQQYDAIEAALIQLGKIRKQGDLLIAI